MAYKEVRDLFEYLRILGYPKHLKLSSLYTVQGSLDSFKIVFDILRWLIDRYEPGAVIFGGTDTEVDRIVLTRSCVEFLVVKAGIKLNPLKLYSGSMAAAEELLKVVHLIMKVPAGSSEKHIDRFVREVDIEDKIEDRQRGRELSSELTTLGATLFDLTEKEETNTVKRNQQINRQMEQSVIEKILKNIVNSTQHSNTADKVQLEALIVEKQTLATKLERKKSDYERLKQRLDTLQKIRPAFSEEFENCEEELKKLYSLYFMHIRCLDALRAQGINNDKNTITREPIKQASAADAPSLILLPYGIADSSDEISEDDENDDLNLKPKRDLTEAVHENQSHGNEHKINQKLRIKTGIKREERRIVGDMTGVDTGSDLDSSLDYKDISDTDSEQNDELLFGDENNHSVYNYPTANAARKSAKTKVYQSDEDF